VTDGSAHILADEKTLLDISTDFPALKDSALNFQYFTKHNLAEVHI
jgi:hypothetical protein